MAWACPADLIHKVCLSPCECPTPRINCEQFYFVFPLSHESPIAFCTSKHLDANSRSGSLAKHYEYSPFEGSARHQCLSSAYFQQAKVLEINNSYVPLPSVILGVCATAGEDKEPNLLPLPHFMIILLSRTVILLRVIVKKSLHAQATLRPTTLGEFLRKAGTWLVKKRRSMRRKPDHRPIRGL
jgi:hypothetical protein